MANAIDPVVNSTEAFIGSREKAKNNYGQGGYQGASSQLPGDKPAKMMDLRDDAVLDIVKQDGSRSGVQLRKIRSAQYPTHPGMRDRSLDDLEKVPAMTLRGTVARHPVQAARRR